VQIGGGGEAVFVEDDSVIEELDGGVGDGDATDEGAHKGGGGGEGAVAGGGVAGGVRVDGGYGSTW